MDRLPENDSEELNVAVDDKVPEMEAVPDIEEEGSLIVAVVVTVNVEVSVGVGGGVIVAVMVVDSEKELEMVNDWVSVGVATRESVDVSVPVGVGGGVMVALRDSERLDVVDWESDNDAVTDKDCVAEGENDGEAALTDDVAVTVGVGTSDCEALWVRVKVGEADDENVADSEADEEPVAPDTVEVLVGETLNESELDWE